MADQKGDDPTGVIREAYRMEGITLEQCRSIFFEWAMSLPEGTDARQIIPRLLETYGDEGHPMTGVLKDGMEAPPEPTRRGGRSARVS
ncbi:hypothetical protein ACXN5S_05125 [Pseudoroseicyclus sp. H15]